MIFLDISPIDRNRLPSGSALIIHSFSYVGFFFFFFFNSVDIRKNFLLFSFSPSLQVWLLRN
jgi:hypothetical protein